MVGQPEGDNEDMDGGVGARLREARVQRGLDLAEVAAATKIHARFLRAIENEEWDLLPGEFYARSFARGYADHLGLDERRVAEAVDSAPGLGASGDRLPRIDPAPPQEARSVRRARFSSRPLAAIAAVGLVVIALAVGLSSLGGDSSGPSPQRQTGGGEQRQATPSPAGQPPGRAAGPSLTLTTSAEVWVCLLDERGRALIAGEILEPGAEEGPYRSASFMLSLGNGSVTLSVEGRPASIPQTPNPIGFSIDSDGALRQLSEAERPTCT
jgi:cytoskeleton protein RodZ